MKIIVYLREADAREIEAGGQDPAHWVREVVKKALALRKGSRDA